MSIESRIYYTDAYATEFEAQIVEHLEVNGKPAIILDKTVFYPTSGGQPHDLGDLTVVGDDGPDVDVDVIDVFYDTSDRIVHVLSAPVPIYDTYGQVSGLIDWMRRFDFMQHHTGQHILSRVFELVNKAETVGFHLTENNATIDLNIADIDDATLQQVEDWANMKIFEDEAVEILFPEENELERLPLRKISEKIKGQVRVIKIGDFDICACGGTHVARTGEIGMIKIIGTERVRKQTRVTFACGQRALEDYRHKNGFLNELAARYTMAYTDLPSVLDKLRDENKTLQKQLKSTRAELMKFRATELRESAAHTTAQYTIITAAFSEDDATPGDLQILARELIIHAQTVALLGIYGEQAQLVMARSDDLTLDMSEQLKSALEMLGTQRGGGRPNMAQGGGVAATKAAVRQALGATRNALL